VADMTTQPKANDKTRDWLFNANIVVCSVLAFAAFLAVGFAVWWTTPPCTKMSSPKNHLPSVCTGRSFDAARWALIYAAPITVLLIILVAVLFYRPSGDGVVGFINGKDNQLSTSKTQVALWTIAIIFAFLFFTIQVIHSGTSKATTSGFSHFGPEYLLLLGGPFAAAVLAGATTANKVDSGTVQPVQASAPSASDLVTDTTGSPSISDAQFLLFNTVALVYFAVALARSPQTLPNIPDTLVGLTSVSALTYLGAKVVSSNQPTITSVSITSTPSNGLLHAGDEIKIIGSGFDPAGGKPDSGSAIEVLFNGVAARPDSTSDTQLTVKVPPGLTGPASGQMSIAIITSAGVLTPTPFTGLMIEGPRITSLTKNGTTIVVDGYGLDLASSPQISVKDSTNNTVPVVDTVEVASGETGKFKFNLRQETSGPYTVTVTVNDASSSMTIA
jgi:preprotein translocase subunit SecG